MLQSIQKLLYITHDKKKKKKKERERKLEWRACINQAGKAILIVVQREAGGVIERKQPNLGIASKNRSNTFF